ncbi:hypothetical protein MiSe_23560 [Microseira wollei NIES-4236]|uniref:Uncharacterized protein n=1 Tax=Microseira wollei NIES-4236 TaxID=2530354 RepID=A0AAV3XDW8_9CYAN|nr:hypothetical protein MiSe_23560 [Microseira wollei NIES-4236]
MRKRQQKWQPLSHSCAKRLYQYEFAIGCTADGHHRCHQILGTETDVSKILVNQRAIARPPMRYASGTLARSHNSPIQVNLDVGMGILLACMDTIAPTNFPF